MKMRIGRFPALALAAGAQLASLGGCAAPDEGMWPFFAKDYDPAKTRDYARAHHLCLAAPLSVEALSTSTVIARDARGDYIRLSPDCRLDPKNPVTIAVADDAGTPCIGEDFVLQFRGASSRTHRCTVYQAWRMTPDEGQAEVASFKRDPTGQGYVTGH